MSSPFAIDHKNIGRSKLVVGDGDGSVKTMPSVGVPATIIGVTVCAVAEAVRQA